MAPAASLPDLRTAWARGTALGAWLFLREPLAAETASKAGYDYVCVDMQHGLAELSETLVLLQAISLGPAVPIVRVPWNEPGIIGRVLDGGAMGVVVPMVNSAADAERAVAACRYAPRGARSMGPISAMTRYGPGYFGAADDAVACIPMIETAEALEHIDDILTVPGVDAVYVGPADLSVSLGLPPGMDHDDPVFTGALAAVLAACDRHGVVPGVHADAALAAKRASAGFRMVTVGFDHMPMVAGLHADAASARAAVAPDPHIGSR